MAFWISGKDPAPFDWLQIIAFQTKQLANVLALVETFLFAADGTPWIFISRATRTRVLQLLRPAESALRRLIILIAETQLKPLSAHAIARLMKPPKAQPLGEYALTLLRSRNRKRQYRFDLIDLETEFGEVIEVTDHNRSVLFPAKHKRALSEKPDPHALDIKAAPLRKRLLTLHAALKRARHHARAFQKLKTLHQNAKSVFLPLKVGLPLGMRRSSSRPNEAEEVLADCHYFAREALNSAPP